MSWLLAACFPGLLMVFAVGLQRLETLLHDDLLSVVQLVARLSRAARTARHRAVPRTLGGLSAPQPVLLLMDEPGLPTRPNPVFQPSG